MRFVINFWWFVVVLEYSLSNVLVFTFMILGNRDLLQVVQTVQIDIQKFSLTESGSNLAFPLQNIAQNFHKMQVSVSNT